MAKQSIFEFPDAEPPRPPEPLPELRGVKALGFDTETDLDPVLWRKLYGISYFVPGGPAGYVSLRHPNSLNHDEAAVRRWLQNEVAGKTLICANAKHEVHVMRTFGVDLEELGCTLRDVFHAAALVQEKRYRLNLDLLMKEELGRKKEAVDHATLYQRPAWFVAPIAIEDARATVELDAIYQQRIDAEDLNRVQDLENSLVYCTAEMERNGEYLDVEKLMRWDAEAKTAYEERILRIYRETGLNINPDSPKDMPRLFNHLGLVNNYFTATGQESYAEDVLQKFVDQHPLVQVVIEALELSSLRSKFLTKYIRSVQPDGRIYSTFHQLRNDDGGTITGRFSSSYMWKGPGGGYNAQQVMKTEKMSKLLSRWPVRDLFIAPPGETRVCSDASQIEFRVMAHYAEKALDRPRLAEQYRQNPDTDFHKVVIGWTNLIRSHAKTVSFCKMYGGREKKIAFLCGVSLERATEIVRQYDEAFPEPNMLLAMAERLARNRGYVRTLMGRRRRYLPGNQRGERYYSAFNACGQGTAADLMKLKLRQLYGQRKELGLKLRTTVHDEVNGTIQDPAMFPRFCEAMAVQNLPMVVPIVWKSKTGHTWDECNREE